jgi:D-glycero-alpha-D-manno-heptose-7-phosphate kinase
VKVSSNLRVDISGGTLDLWPLYNFVEGAKTINAGLSLVASTEFNLNTKSSEVQIKVDNLNYNKVFKNLDQMFDSSDKELDILKPVLKNYTFNSGFSLTTQSQSPVGGGLGGSSTLLVSIIQVIDQALQISRSEERIVDLACNLESKILNTPAGTQDYYQAVQAGLSLIEFTFEKKKRTFFKSPWLDSQKNNFILIYSGYPHHSGLNNWRIFQKCIDKDPETLSVLKDLKQVSEEVYTELKNPNTKGITVLLNEN